MGFRDDEKNGSAVQGAAGTGIMRPHTTPRLLTGALGGQGAGGPGPQGWTLLGEGRWEGAPQGPNTAAPSPQAEATGLMLILQSEYCPELQGQ